VVTAGTGWVGTSAVVGEVPERGSCVEEDEGFVDGGATAIGVVGSDGDDTTGVGRSVPEVSGDEGVGTVSWSEEDSISVRDVDCSASNPLNPFCQRKEPTSKIPRKRRNGSAQNDKREGADGAEVVAVRRSGGVLVRESVRCNSATNCPTTAFVSNPKNFA
jgi:hypothetical protein